MTPILFLVLGPGNARAQSIPVPLTKDVWVVSQKHFKLEQDEDSSRNGEIVEFQGRRSLRVSKGLFYARGVEFRNGTIEVEMAPGPNGRFLGIAFRVQSEADYEVIFFRPGASGTTQAVQYTPGLLGANAWQIYTGPGYTAAANVPRNEWIHVRLVVSGVVARLFLDRAAEPSLVVRDLKLGDSKGSIGFWGHMGDAYFANLSYTPDAAAHDPRAKPEFLPGALTDWELSQMFDATETNPAVYPGVHGLKWESVAAESPGMVVINRYRESPNVLPPERADRLRGDVRGGKVVFARTTIHSDRDEIRKMSFGYSDEAVVFLNGAPIYAGNNTLSFRQPEFVGLLDAASDAVYLPLKKGENELLLAVTEFFGGWGFLCKLDPLGRVSLESSDALALVGAAAEVVSYRGRRALRISPLPAHEGSDQGLLAILKGLELMDGTFRVQPDGSRFEQLLLRPTNGRAEDQVRRNHSVQYASIPEFPWYRLRKEGPGMHESSGCAAWPRSRPCGRRTSIELPDGARCELMALPDLVQAKKTQRDKDWPMVRRLLEAHYFQNRDRATAAQIRFWLRELRTPELLVETAQRWPRAMIAQVRHRPVLRLARPGREHELAAALKEEEWGERRADARYWAPLGAELERLRLERPRRSN